MTITATIAENFFIGNGVTTEFPTNIYAIASNQIKVYIREDDIDTLQTLTTHYTLSGLSVEGGLTVTMLTAPTASQSLVVERITPQTQETNITASRAFNATVIEDEFDLLTMMIQETAAKADRAFKVAPGIDAPADSFDNTALGQLAIWAAQAQAAAIEAGTPFASYALAEAASIAAPVTAIRVWVDGYLLGYKRQTGATALVTADGATWAPVGAAYAQHYGIIPVADRGDALTDYTARWQDALTATSGLLLLTGFIKVTDATTGNQRVIPHLIYGIGSGGLVASSDFNLSATHIYRTHSTANENSQIGDFQIFMFQDAAVASGDRADLIQYPPAIDIGTGGKRLKTGVIRIEGAYDGLKAVGNIGGGIFEMLEICAFNQGMEVDAAYDFANVRVRFQPFYISAFPNLLSIWNDGNTKGLKLGRCDGWNCESLQSYNAYCEVDHTLPGTLGSTGVFLQLVFQSIQMDGGYGRFEWKEGWGQINGYNGQDQLLISGGRVQINGPNLIGSHAPMLLCTGGVAVINDARVSSRDLTNLLVEVDGGTLILNGIHVEGPAGTRTAYAIKQTSGVLKVRNVTTNTLSGGQPIVYITSDDAGHVILVENRYYIVRLPAGATLGTYNLPQQVAGAPMVFESRSDIVDYLANWNPGIGTILSTPTHSWLYDGSATDISDMLGCTAIAQPLFKHFNVTLATTSGAATDQATAVDEAIAAGAIPDPGYFLYGDFIRGFTPFSGTHTQPHTSTNGIGARSGWAHIGYDVTHAIRDDLNTAQDSFWYIGADLVPPSAGSGYTTEFALLRLNAMITNGTEEGAGPRTLHITTTGDGGHGKLRSIRLRSHGIGGHDGLVSGILATAERHGLVPTSAGGDGIVEYADGDAGPWPNADAAGIFAVGPGIRDVLRLEGSQAPQRPEYAILQAGGGQALLPELAVLSLHAGGNGRILEVWTDEARTTKLLVIEQTGVVRAPSFQSNIAGYIVAPATAVTIPLTRTTGHASLVARSSSANHAMIFFRAAAGSEVCTPIAVGSNIDTTTGNLTGTTGTDTRVTVSIFEQNLVIENRTVASLTFDYTEIA